MLNNKIKTPDQIFGALFQEVQLSQLFPDSKTFADAVPKSAPEIILEEYNQEKGKPSFDLRSFIEKHFDLPSLISSGFKSDLSRTPEEHVHVLWEVLTRSADKVEEGSSLISLPNSYVVPGGRFGEIYYWDSYFTMLGLNVSGKTDMIENMIKNFAYLVNTLGFIPNGNRSYFKTRSQPPFFSLMVELLASIKGDSILLEYLPVLEKEYEFWMNGQRLIKEEGKGSFRRVVDMGLHGILNRYWDDANTPRQESYREDVELTEQNLRESQLVYRDLRAACESGWDFTSRWLEDGASLASIVCSQILPVDLNCLLYNLENVLAKSYALNDQMDHSKELSHRASRRREAICKIFWSHAEQTFCDYNFKSSQLSPRLSAAMSFPLFFNIATKDQANKTAGYIESNLLAPGGLLTTPYETGQQWDAPNGWAPLQWMAVQGLISYGYNKLAMTISNRWCKLCEKVYYSTGKFVEKYDVLNLDLEAGGGEYPVQDGFGWSNGVYLALKQLNTE